jgi:CDGSH-type Zn-finger protein
MISNELPASSPSATITIMLRRPLLASAYRSLTPGRKRGYLLYFSAAKQSHTRVSRIEKSIPKIMTGKGLNDCTCGLSKKMPNCDGSHKQLKLKI